MSESTYSIMNQDYHDRCFKDYPDCLVAIVNLEPVKVCRSRVESDDQRKRVLLAAGYVEEEVEDMEYDLVGGNFWFAPMFFDEENPRFFQTGMQALRFAVRKFVSVTGTVMTEEDIEQVLANAMTEQEFELYIQAQRNYANNPN